MMATACLVQFNFDGYKESELTRRGVFDKTKWH